MLKNVFERGCQAFSALMGKTISAKQLSRLCIVLIVLMLLPLVVIALYNYPADDDFGFVLPVAEAWVTTGSLWEVVKSLFGKVYDTYMSWQGYFVSTTLFSVTPMIFGVQWYFLDNWLMLALLCLSSAYLVRGIIRLLNTSPSVFWIVYTAFLVLVIQFMPSIGYSVFWHNGGQYTTAACILFLTIGLFLRSADEQTTRRSIFRSICAAICGFMLGGSFFGPALGALVLIALWTLWAFCTHSRNRPQCVSTLIFFLIAFAISVTAPGNGVRQDLNGPPASIISTVLTSALDSFDLAASWLSPQLLAMLLLIVAVLWHPLKSSVFQFRHPVLVMISLFGLVAASLAPALYAGAEYKTERYLNALYLYFLLFACGTVIYAEGWLIRRLERGQAISGHLLSAAKDLGRRFSIGFLALVIALTVFGGFEYTIMNTSSISAVKSLLTGEAAEFREEMRQREAYILATPSDETIIHPLRSQPHVFKYDRLPYQGIYGRIRYMKMYFELFENAKQ